MGRPSSSKSNKIRFKIIQELRDQARSGDFDPFCNNEIIWDKSRFNHICRDRQERKEC